MTMTYSHSYSKWCVYTLQ